MHPKYIQSSIILFITLKLTSSDETNAPVYEVINEQARIDDKIRVSNAPGLLPYGNPLAGNSKQNARLHISNQQAMFNAERVRQHKAQIQRWNQSPKIIDSYMKAYHDLQETHQAELEQQQATLNDSPVTSPRPNRTRQRPQNKVVQNDDENLTEKPTPNRVQNQRKQLPRRGSQRIDPLKITKTDSVKDLRNRNHRSYGSANYNQQLEPKGYKTVYITPGSTYGEGISINTNGNSGFKQIKEPTKLYTEAIPSNTKPTYPKLDQKFTSVQEIEALNSLLAKNPEQQLTGFTSLIDAGKNDELNKDIPIDFYFYLRNPTQNQNIDESKYGTYASAFAPVVKDHTPITEEVDDIEDTRAKQLINQPELTEAPKIETATAKNNNYYKVEVASQTISNELNKKPFSHYGYQTNSDKSERYLHHNAQITGVQHLLEDGTETSAFDDNVSTRVRNKRSKLETEPFLVPDEKSANATDTPTSDALIRLNSFPKQDSDLNVFLTNFPMGEASYNDYDYKKSRAKLQAFYDDDDYYDDFGSPDYDFGSKSHSYLHNNYDVDSKASFSNQFRNFRRPLSNLYGTPPSTSYGVPYYAPSILDAPQSYFPSKFESISSIQNVEPVYLLTQSQLKELMGHHNLNIQHLDVFQVSKEKSKKDFHYPRKYKKRYPFRRVRNNLYKLRKFRS